MFLIVLCQLIFMMLLIIGFCLVLWSNQASNEDRDENTVVEFMQPELWHRVVRLHLLTAEIACSFVWWLTKRILLPVARTTYSENRTSPFFFASSWCGGGISSGIAWSWRGGSRGVGRHRIEGKKYPSWNKQRQRRDQPSSHAIHHCLTSNSVTISTALISFCFISPSRLLAE